MRVAYARPGLVKIYAPTSYPSPNISESDRLAENYSSDESSDIQNQPCTVYDEFWQAIFREGRISDKDCLYTKHTFQFKELRERA